MRIRVLDVVHLKLTLFVNTLPGLWPRLNVSLLSSS